MTSTYPAPGSMASGSGGGGSGGGGDKRPVPPGRSHQQCVSILMMALTGEQFDPMSLIMLILIGWDEDEFIEKMPSANLKQIFEKEKFRRELNFRNSKERDDFLRSGPTNHKSSAVVIQLKGASNPVPCGGCQAGLGPFQGCYSFKADTGRYGKAVNNCSCANCAARNDVFCDYSKPICSDSYSLTNKE